MSGCGGKTWELTLTVDSTGKAIDYELGISDILGSNNIGGNVHEGNVDVSRLTGTCTPGPGPGQSHLSCAFNVKGVSVGGVKIQMDGTVTGNKFDGTFTVTNAGVAVPKGTALADPGDTGTSGGTAVTLLTGKARPAESKEQETPAGEAPPYGR